MKRGPKRRIHIDPTTGCHIPLGKQRSKSGYPQYKHNGRRLQATRVVWLETYGEGSLSDDVELDHVVCQNRECVNVEHLEPVTRLENIHRSRVTKLTREQVVAIRASDLSTTALAAQYGVCISTVSLARRGITWKSIPLLKSHGRAGG